jgi:hypothetical protein
MNWWVKRTGQLFLAALFLMSCNDDSLLLGFRNPNEKFQVRYVELPVESSVVLLDSVNTMNFFREGPNRLLVGKYSDAEFGEISSEAYTQYFYDGPDRQISSEAELMSCTIHLRYDFYTYGSPSNSPIEFQIYELDEELDNDSVLYFADNPISYSNLIAEASTQYSPAAFEKIIDDGKTDSVLMLDIPLPFNEPTMFASRLFTSARNSIGTADTTVTNFETFKKIYKGLAIVPVVADKVFGINPNKIYDTQARLVDTASSRINFRYKTPTDTFSINFYFGSITSFSHVTSDRSITPLSGLTTKYTEYEPVNDNRHVQPINGIVTKVNIDALDAFIDTIPAIVFNSAEFVVSSINDAGNATPPNSLTLKPISKASSNRFLIESRLEDSVLVSNYKIFTTVNRTGADFLNITNDGSYFVVDDIFQDAQLRLQNNSYSGFITNYVNKYYEEYWEYKKSTDPEKKDIILREFYLYNYSPSHRKSLERAVFHKDNLKLRIYYSVPVNN